MTPSRPDLLFRAFADETRLRILSLLVPGELCVCDIVSALGLGQPKISRHLAYLRRAGLVSARKEGLWKHYSLTPPADAFHKGLLGCLRGCFSEAPSLRRDRERLEKRASEKGCVPASAPRHGASSGRRVKRVLFLCTGNSCRSQMAEALLNRMGRGRFLALSAGSRPAGFVHPLAVGMLREAGCPVKGLSSKSLEEFRGKRFDAVITVCDRAKEACPLWPGARMLHWSLKDPAEAEGTGGQRRAVFRGVFRDLESRLRTFLRAESRR